MPTGVDQIADRSGVELSRLYRLYDFPDFVKKAAHAILEPKPRAKSAYADPVRDQFPCDSPAATWLSALYFQEKQAEFHPKDRTRIENRLNEYAAYWGVRGAVDGMQTRWQELHKTAEEQLPDSSYAWVWTGEDGRKERRLRLKSAAEVKAAAEWLLQYRDRIPFRDRHVIAEKILEKAATFGAGLGDKVEFLEKQAGRGMCDPAALAVMVDYRVRLLANHPEQQEKVAALADSVRHTARGTLHPEMLIKLAETVDLIDRSMGLVGKYGEHLKRPEDVIFADTFTKTASAEADRVTTGSGSVYKKEALSKLAIEDVRSLFGNEFVSRISNGIMIDPEKMAAEAAALPRPDAVLLDALMNDHGMAPLRVKAAGEGFSSAQWAEFAEAYVPRGRAEKPGRLQPAGR